VHQVPAANFAAGSSLTSCGTSSNKKIRPVHSVGNYSMNCVPSTLAQRSHETCGITFHGSQRSPIEQAPVDGEKSQQLQRERGTRVTVAYEYDTTILRISQQFQYRVERGGGGGGEIKKDIGPPKN
jgi:hypothetical protein